MLIHWLWLAHRPGINDRMKAVLLQHFQDPEDLYFADQKALAHIDGLSPEGLEALQDKKLVSAEQILEACQQEDLHILTYRDAAYPAALKNIPDPPLVLYYKGQLPSLDSSPVIGVVGTRKASAYGLTSAKRLGYQIGKCGGIVVSGMAYGIDGMAMSGALTAGAKVVGVLGCGADLVYPLSNRALFKDVERYGCILSEFPPGTPPVKWNFPKRNRIISGLSNGVLVVEAPEKSGALITARLAAEQGRDVFAVPGNIDMPSFVGSNRLLRDGAIMVSSGWDILSEYEALYPDKIRKETAPVHQTAYPDEVEAAGAEPEKTLPKVAQTAAVPGKKTHLKKKLEKKSIDKEPSSAYSDVNKEKPKLSEEEQMIVSALQSGERLVDDVIAETGLTTGKLLSSLTMLELKGVLRRLPGKRISLK
ncbi:MAG: DNA-processing protein DprA [Oscillospiraceae bacterium]|nr:DNA-processing protein DprA [Oscillospiraceae bacterium]